VFVSSRFDVGTIEPGSFATLRMTIFLVGEVASEVRRVAERISLRYVWGNYREAECALPGAARLKGIKKKKDPPLHESNSQGWGTRKKKEIDFTPREGGGKRRSTETQRAERRGGKRRREISSHKLRAMGQRFSLRRPTRSQERT
jgi:hypothetical protein